MELSDEQAGGRFGRTVSTRYLHREVRRTRAKGGGGRPAGVDNDVLVAAGSGDTGAGFRNGFCGDEEGQGEGKEQRRGGEKHDAELCEV